MELQKNQAPVSNLVNYLDDSINRFSEFSDNTKQAILGNAELWFRMIDNLEK